MTLKDTHLDLILRISAAAVLILIGVGIALRFGMLWAYPFWTVASVLIAFPLADRLANPFGGLLLPRDKFSRPQPMYSIPRSLRMKNELEAAMTAYRKIAAEYPRELRVYVEMIRLAHVDMKEDRLAEQILKQGLGALKKEALKAELQKEYAAILTLSHTPPTAEDRRKVPYSRRAG